MERMIESRDIKHMACVERIKQLEEENKKLNEEIQRFKDNAMQDMREITELEIENKKLKEDIKKIEESQEYRYHRCMKAERGGEDED